MLNKGYTTIDPSALLGSMRDYRVQAGTDLSKRGDNFFKWQNVRRENGVWPFSRSTQAGPGTVCDAADDGGHAIHGINFASQDYLSLSAHPAMREVAIETIRSHGVHSAGSSALVGNTNLSVALERRIADYLHMEESILYPTGWAAGYGVIRGLVRSSDHIVMDQLSHVCLQEGANAATDNIYQFRHLDVDHCRRKLASIRAKDTENAILVVTEGLFSMDSDTPDLAALQAVAHEYDARLVVDVAHDFGCLGDGHGHIGLQNMLGKIDLVMGSFSKTFGSNGGFVACKTRALKEYLKFYSPSATFSNALSPMQAAVVLKAFDIIESAEGDQLRAKMLENVLLLRNTLKQNGMDYYGDPSAIVAVKMGTESLARLVSRRLPELGLLSNLVEYPAVAKGAARFRMQVMAGHTHANIRDAVQIMKQAVAMANEELQALADAPAAPVAAAA